MIQNAIIVSLIITSIYVSMREGMIFEKIRIQLHLFFDKNGQGEWLGKPLCDCLTCMGGFWTILLYPVVFGYDSEMLVTIFLVIGINSIIDKILNFEL